jgi:hypothetical protein
MPPVGMVGGRYGGAGYSHVLDAFMVLFNHFISCGVWEAVAMLDGFLKNTADIPPEILHAETQGQRTPVCGLAPPHSTEFSGNALEPLSIRLMFQYVALTMSHLHQRSSQQRVRHETPRQGDPPQPHHHR